MLIENKILSLPALLRKLPALRRRSKTIAFTNGCFDLMHIGHVKYLEDASRGRRVLIVGLNSDRSIRRIKGPGRPILVQKSRAAVLAALESVDFVVIFNEDTPYRTVQCDRHRTSRLYSGRSGSSRQIGTYPTDLSRCG